MTIKTLVKKLQALPQNLLACVDGYENGFNAVRGVQQILLVKQIDPDPYEGEYKKFDAEDDEGKKAKAAVILL